MCGDGLHCYYVGHCYCVGHKGGTVTVWGTKKSLLQCRTLLISADCTAIIALYSHHDYTLQSTTVQLVYDYMVNVL